MDGCAVRYCSRRHVVTPDVDTTTKLVYAHVTYFALTIVYTAINVP